MILGTPDTLYKAQVEISSCLSGLQCHFRLRPVYHAKGTYALGVPGRPTTAGRGI